MKHDFIVVAIIAAAIVISSTVVYTPAHATEVICTSGGCGVHDDNCQCSWQLAIGPITLPKNISLTISSNNQTSLVEELTRQISLHPNDMIKNQVNAMLYESSRSRVPINDTTLMSELSKLK